MATTSTTNTVVDNVIAHYVQQLNIKSCAGKMADKVFTITNGRKYAKVVSSNKGGNHNSVFCFIDRNTGEVYKAATWKSPAKHVRYTLTDEESAQNLAHNSDPYGSFLYMR